MTLISLPLLLSPLPLCPSPRQPYFHSTSSPPGGTSYQPTAALVSLGRPRSHCEIIPTPPFPPSHNRPSERRSPSCESPVIVLTSCSSIHIGLDEEGEDSSTTSPPSSSPLPLHLALGGGVGGGSAQGPSVSSPNLHHLSISSSAPPTTAEADRPGGASTALNGQLKARTALLVDEGTH